MPTKSVTFKLAISLSIAFIRSEVEANEKKCKQGRLADADPDVAH